MSKSKLCLKTGLFEEDFDLITAINPDKTVNLQDLKTNDEWDALVDDLLDFDLIISL